MTLVKKKKSVSKKRKDAWRKFSDIADVEDYLEKKQTQERITGGDIELKSDADLFKIQHVGEDIGDSVYKFGKSDRAKITPLRRRKAANIKEIELKCFSNLKNDSKVPPPHLGSKRNMEKYLDRLNEKEVNFSDRRLDRGKLQRDKRRNEREKVRMNRRKGGVVRYDAWGDDGEDDPERPPAGCRTQRTKPSLLQAVEPPHAGASYNPSLADHEELLLKAATIEAVKMKKEERVERWWRRLHQSNLATSSTWLEEMSVGVVVEDDDKVHGNTNESSDIMTYGSVDRNRKKTRHVRNKEKAEQSKTKFKKKQKMLKQKAAEMNRMKVIKKEVESEEEKRKEMEKNREIKRIREGTRTKRLGLLRYEEHDLDVKLPEDMSGSLRTLKTEGSLMKDRFLSLQKRNVIEPRERYLRQKKYKLKRFKKKES